LDKKEYWEILSHPDRRFIDLKRVDALLSDAPKSLYKYCPTSVEAITNFASDQIWLECPIKFNDPLDTVFNTSGFTLFKEPPLAAPKDAPFPDVGNEFDAWEKEWGFSDIWRLNENRKELANARGIKIYQMARGMRDGFTSLIPLDITTGL
jgi:hypothetical protein